MNGCSTGSSGSTTRATRDAGGAGLGLAVVDTVVRSLGGSIVAESSPLGGARLRAEFPPVS